MSADEELQTQITLLESPLGGGPHDRERQRAAEWLRANRERSYPALLARVRERRARPASVELLGELGGADSIPILSELLGADELVGPAAANALAAHPDPAATTALREALRGGGDRAVRAADALGARGDDAACPELKAALATQDGRLRYHALQAAVRLGCTSDADLAEVADSDQDPDVRALAERSRLP
jgi:HEAT repeat protein